MTCGAVCVCGFEIKMFTLGSCVAYGSLSCTGSVIVYIRFTWVASVRSELRTGYPAANDGMVMLGFYVRMCRMSETACTRKSIKLKAGNSILCGENSTVSHARVSFVRGK